MDTYLNAHHDLMFGANLPAMNNREIELKNGLDHLAWVLVDSNKSSSQRIDELLLLFPSFPVNPLTDSQLSAAIYAAECFSSAAQDEISRRNELLPGCR